MPIISADSHIDTHWLPFDLFTSNASAQMRERMPFVVDTPQGKRWMTRAGVTFGLAGGVGGTGKPYVPGSSHRADRMAESGLYRDSAKGILRLTDPHLRVKDQELDGVDAEVLYGMLGASVWLRDIEASWEMARVYNDWLVEFCASYPDRLLGLASIPTHDPARAAAEILRVAKRGGIKGIDLSGGETGGMPLYHESWAPVWNAIDETALPVHFHTLGPTNGRPNYDGFSELDIIRHRAEGLANCQYDRAALVMRETILGGVLHAHPSIRLVLSESGIGWIPYLLERMDINWEDQYRPFLGLDRKPSEYWFRQCAATYQLERFGSSVIEKIGEDNVMWASDFPHPDGLWPDSKIFIEEQFANLPTRIREKVLGGTAAKIYGLPASIAAGQRTAALA